LPPPPPVFAVLLPVTFISSRYMSALLFFLAALAVSTTAAPLSVNEFDLAEQLRRSQASCEQCMELVAEIHYCIKHGFCGAPCTPPSGYTGELREIFTTFFNFGEPIAQ
jgi:hypothetical protein